MKYTHLNILLTGVLLAVTLNTFGQAEWQKKYSGPETVREMFVNPPMFYAPHTFWFWDDTIRDEHFTATMAEDMMKQRLNPGYAHPRSSMDRLNPKLASLPYGQYLEKPWFNSFGNAMKAAKEKGFTLGYCDEYDWPSGQAAGRVLKLHPELEAKYLDWKRYKVTGKSTVQYDSTDFAVAGKIVNKVIDASSLRIIGEGNHVKWTAPPGEWVVYTYTKKYHPGIDGGKVNYLDPGLMKAFIPLVHEQYAKRFENDMGKTIPGVFVDNEGDYGWRMAWSEYLAQRYKEMKKQDIRLWLPLLTEKDKDGLFAKARCDWFDVVSDVYNKCYFEPLVNWLKQYNMYYISNLWEESLLLQAAAMGDFMRVTRTATMPGTDCLLMKSQDVHDFKEVQTVAELEDRPFMSEIMGVAGWEQTPAMMKATINSITSFGINHVVPHGINVNRKIEADPYPPDWFTENPYWPYLHNWTDFSRRAAFVNRQSKLVADVLLVNPLESIWANSEGIFTHEERFDLMESTEVWDTLSLEINQVYSDAMRELNRNNIDFLIADKYYLDRGKIGSNDKDVKITINDHDFSAIVLPPACVISHAVSAKLLAFAEKGGIVLLLGATPAGSPEKGMKDPAIIRQMTALKRLPNVIDLSGDKDKLNKMVTALNERIRPQIRLENSGRLYTAHRRISNSHLYWLANNSDTVRNFSAWFRDGDGAAEIWNCETGKRKPVVSVKEKGYNKVSMTLQPYEGYWLVFDPETSAMDPSVQKEFNLKEIKLADKWTISYPGKDTVYKTTAKSLTLAGSELSENLMQSAYDDSKWKYSSFIGGQNPKGADQKKEAADTGSYCYWRVNIPVGSRSVLFPDNMTGTTVWIDGTKTSLSTALTDLPGNARLLSFARPVKSEHVPTDPLKFIIGDKANCALQSWYDYGLQQYSGYIDYEMPVVVKDVTVKTVIDLGKVKYMAEVFVNNKSVGDRIWPPFVFDISKYLQEGENTIRVRIGNLMVNEMWMKSDMGALRTWGWVGAPDFNKYDAGLFGPVKLVQSK